jgi:hypothetical protein
MKLLKWQDKCTMCYFQNCSADIGTGVRVGYLLPMYYYQDE